MILIDSIYINNGGGRVLLNYLVKKFQNEKLPIFYLFDDRCKGGFIEVPEKQKVFLKASIYNRRKFYKENSNKFSAVLCFGNIPPPIKVKAVVYTYFHQRLFLEIPKGTNLKDKLLFGLKSNVWNFFKENTNYWLLQSSLVATDLKNKLHLPDDRIIVLPFYPPIISSISNYKRKNNSFLYVSSGAPHKNHLILIDAFCNFYDRHKVGTLALTIGSEFHNLIDTIAEKANSGYPIINYGHLDREKIGEIYTLYEYHIYPSLSESFGLGLLESIECGCKVIGANLPYTFAVCSPSIVFDPYDIDSIENAFESAIKKNEGETVQHSYNEINKLLQLLKNEEDK